MANDPKYTAATARADKLLEPDGSVKTASGTAVSGPSASGAAAYSAATARADKLLEPDGSIVTSGAGGTSTPPGGATGQLQYNNAGAFGGTTNITTDGTNLTFGVANAQLIGNIAATNVQLAGSTLQLSGSTFISCKIGAYFNMYINGTSVNNGGVGIGKPSGAPVVAANGNCLDIGNGVAATAGANQSSGQMGHTGNFWNGSASAQDWWSVTNVLGTGTNPTSTLTFSHGGTNTGALSVLIPNLALASMTTATSATAGAASALPTAPTGYLQITINGTVYKIPYYSV